MEQVLNSCFRIGDADAGDIIARLKLDNMNFSKAPQVKQKLVSAVELRGVLEAFPAVNGWLLYTDGLVNFMKRSEDDRSREILELEICDAGTAAGDCRTLRAVLISENSYSVTLILPSGQEDTILGKDPDKGAGENPDKVSGDNWVYAFSDISAVLKNSFRSTLDGEGLARYRVWYRCSRNGDCNSDPGRWMPWMQQFSGFVK